MTTGKRSGNSRKARKRAQKSRDMQRRAAEGRKIAEDNAKAPGHAHQVRDDGQ